MSASATARRTALADAELVRAGEASTASGCDPAPAVRNALAALDTSAGGDSSVLAALPRRRARESGLE
jgi:hypothetical protein